MSGVFSPVPGDPDIIWKTYVHTDKGDYYASVISAREASSGAAYLYIWNPKMEPIHRSRTAVTASALFGIDRKIESEWDAEITKVLQHPEYRRFEDVQESE
jgi:hypothetical protein